MKGMSLISGVLFLAFLIFATSIVYWTITPTIEKIRCSVVVEKMKNAFVNLDETIQKVSSESEGSRRTINFNIDEGEFVIDGENDVIYWKYECESPMVSPRTFQKIGNVIFGSNLDTKAYEDVCRGEQAYVLENEHLKVCIKKVGTEEIYSRYNISEILLSIYQKDLNQVMPLERLEITLDNNETSSVGLGYTKLSKYGQHLPYGEVTAYIESDYGINYRIKFILESGEDFLIIKGE